MGFKQIPYGSLEEFNVIIEIPQGSQDKYEYREDLDLIELDRVLFTAQRYPANYGFVPQTRAEDGDHADVLLFSTNPFFHGALVKSRAIGFMKMDDSGEVDDKILAVPVNDVRFAHIESMDQLPEHSQKEIANFFETYKLLQNKEVKVTGFEPKENAIKYLQKTLDVYSNEKK